MGKQKISDGRIFLYSIVITLVLVLIYWNFSQLVVFPFLNPNSSQVMLFSIIFLSLILTILVVKSNINWKNKIKVIIAVLIFTIPRFLVSIGGNGDIRVSLYVFAGLIGTYLLAIFLVHSVIMEEIA